MYAAPNSQSEIWVVSLLAQFSKCDWLNLVCAYVQEFINNFMHHIPRFLSHDLLGNFQFLGVPHFGLQARMLWFSSPVLLCTSITAPVFGARWQQDRERHKEHRIWHHFLETAVPSNLEEHSPSLGIWLSLAPIVSSFQMLSPQHCLRAGGGGKIKESHNHGLPHSLWVLCVPLPIAWASTERLLLERSLSAPVLVRSGCYNKITIAWVPNKQ